MDNIELLKVNEMTNRAIKTSETAINLAETTEDRKEADDYLKVAMEAQELANWLIAYQAVNMNVLN